jgi:atypical dual specificity phosphatase
MLSFPAANWEKARAVMKPSPAAARNSGFGRLASRITPRLYLSDYFTASDAEKLAMHGITHVISVVDFTPTIPAIIERDRMLHVPIVDQPDADLLQYLDQTTTFIIQALEENETNKVLVSHASFIPRLSIQYCALSLTSTRCIACRASAEVRLWYAHTLSQQLTKLLPSQ